jgi:GrpB-like predicted nucleotidyltransferase (UPF0157 family)
MIAPHHLRTDAADRTLYGSTKRDLATREWPTVQHYADAKTDVIAGIVARAMAPRSADDRHALDGDSARRQ